MAVKRTRNYARKANQAIKQAGKIANQLDRAVGGQLVKYNPYGQLAAQASHLVTQGLDYFDTLMDVTHPQIMSGQVAGVANNVMVKRSKPRITSSSGSVRIQHKELVWTVRSDVNLATSNLFTTGASVYQINAQSGTTFPWLSQIAACFDYYKFHRVRLVYVPFCATSEIGRVMIGYDPDSTDPVQNDRMALSSYSCSAEGSSWGQLALDLKLADTNKWYYTNTTGSTATPGGAYLDQGQVFSACWNGTSNTIGEVYILYDVSLKDPQPPDSLVYTASGTGATVTEQFPTNTPVFVSSTATTVTLKGLTNGSFLVVLDAKATAFGSTILTDVNGVGQQGDSSSGSEVIVCSNYRFNKTGGTVVFSGLTALGNYVITCVRCGTAANVAPV